MRNRIEKTAVCPACGKTYTAEPALSRKDNTTLICSDCGILEALSTLGISTEEQKRILETIHGCMRNSADKLDK